MVSIVLKKTDKIRTYQSLAAMMGIQDPVSEIATQNYIDDHTLIRRIENFDPDSIRMHSKATLKGREENQPLTFKLSKRQLPENLIEGWEVRIIDEETVEITAKNINVFLENARKSKVSSAGQLPTGFNPGDLYPSRNHPRGLQLAVFGASDALHSSGLSLETLKENIEPDQFAVYSGSAMGQLDPEGFGGMFQNPLLGFDGHHVIAAHAPLPGLRSSLLMGAALARALQRWLVTCNSCGQLVMHEALRVGTQLPLYIQILRTHARDTIGLIS